MIAFYECQAKLNEALEYGNKALKIMEEQYGPDSPNVSFTLVRLGRVLMGQRKYQEAKVMYKRAYKICEEKVLKQLCDFLTIIKARTGSHRHSRCGLRTGLLLFLKTGGSDVKGSKERQS